MTAQSDQPYTDIGRADRLYREFPDLSGWGRLTAKDVDLWNRFASSLEQRRAQASPDALQAAAATAMRAAAIDTGAIEGLYSVDRGFTMTVALQTMAWEQAIAEKGAEVRDFFMAQLEAYEMVLDAATKKAPVTEAWIRVLHETLCAPQETYKVHTAIGTQESSFPKGFYKTQPNHVLLKDGTFHAYAPVDRVPQEMHRLVEILASPEFDKAHPVLQASYAHYALVNVHPFADGNGRVARALASLFFYRALSIPLLIFADQRLPYFDAVHAVDERNTSHLIKFFVDRVLDLTQHGIQL